MKPPLFKSSIVFTFALTVFVTELASLTQAPCRTDSDTAAMAVSDVQQMLASSGADTTSVSLVSDSTTCSAVVNSYNNVSDPTLRVSSGYVIQTDSNYVLYLPANGTPFKTQQVVIFDRQYHFVLKMEGVG
jgi:hypothetical protein